MIEWPDAGGMVERGEHVRDRERPIETGTVIAVREPVARDYYLDRIDTTVAADNPAYPSGDPVVAVVWSTLDETALPTASEDHTVYHFPVSRLVAESCVRDVAPAALGVSPYHTRAFSWDENRNRYYIYGIRDQGYIGSLPLARETEAGLELVAGNKRRWVAQNAGLATIAVRVVALSEWEAALHFAQDHLPSFDAATTRRTIRALVERWGERVMEIPAVSNRDSAVSAVE